MRVCTIFVLTALLSAAGSSSTHFQDAFEASQSEAGQSSLNSEELYKRRTLVQALAVTPPPPPFPPFPPSRISPPPPPPPPPATAPSPPVSPSPLKKKPLPTSPSKAPKSSPPPLTPPSLPPTIPPSPPPHIPTPAAPSATSPAPKKKKSTPPPQMKPRPQPPALTTSPSPALLLPQPPVRSTSPSPALLPPPPSQVVSTYPMAPGFAFTSSLWGAHGELWEPTGRLLDYSYAGYMANEAPIPSNQTIAADVVQFGAVGDGVTDCTQAFKAAIAAVSSGVIYVPPGTYLITTQLTISNSGVVLRGAGAGVSTIYINNSLTDVFGQLWSGHGEETNISAQSDWKDGPGMIRFAGPGSANLAGVGHVQIGAQDPISNATLLTAITRPALRGSVKVMVASTKALKPNQWVTITIGDVNGTLVKDLYNNVNVTNMCNVTGQPAYCINDLRVMRFHSRIYAVRTNYVVLERPLPFNISLEWVPEVHAFVPGIQQCGIEALTIQFQWKQYAGHLLEDGFNGIEFAGAANCWARDLIISNSDNHLFMWLSSFITVNNVTVTRSVSRGTFDCHHGVNVTWSQDVAVSNSLIRVTCVHDTASFAWNNAVAFSNITGYYRINMDQHGLLPYGTLWSNVYLAKGDRAFLCGGEIPWGDSGASFTTFYNIQSTGTRGITFAPTIHNGPYGNYVGLQWHPQSLLPANTSGQGWLVEGIILPGSKSRGLAVNPMDLLQAMVATRAERFQQLGRQLL